MTASTVLTFGLLVEAKASTAASLTFGSAFLRLICALVSSKISFTSASCSFSRTRSMPGNEPSSASACNCFAEASRTARSGADNLSAANAAFNSRRTRLLMSIDARSSGMGTMAWLLRASTALVSVTIIRSPCGDTYNVPSKSACNAGTASRSPLSASLLIAAILSSFSAAARPLSASASIANAVIGAHSKNHSHDRNIFKEIQDIFLLTKKGPTLRRPPSNLTCLLRRARLSFCHYPQCTGSTDWRAPGPRFSTPR